VVSARIRATIRRTDRPAGDIQGKVVVVRNVCLAVPAALFGLACGMHGMASATPDSVPPVSAQAQSAGFVDIRTVVPDAIIDLRYATSNNFVGQPLYPADARCLVHESMAPGLAAAAAALRAGGEVLVFWDCYRPHDVQVRMSNRTRLRQAMEAGGLTVYRGEWWHFDGPGASVARPILDVPVN
jgi:D-alanyl-D-alanine dipeptidase